MVHFQKLTRYLFLTLQGKTYTVSSGNCPRFSCATSISLARAYCGAAGPVSKMAPQQEKAFCVLRFEVSRSVITMHGLEKTHHAWCVFSKPYTKLTLHCNHRSGHFKTEHTESLFLLWRHLGNWPRSKHEKRTAGSAWETWTVAAADGVSCARVRWEINFLLTFETAPFICKHPVYVFWSSLQILSEIFLILTITERNMIINLYWSSWTVTVFLVRFPKDIQTPNLMKVLPVEATLFHAARRTWWS